MAQGPLSGLTPLLGATNIIIVKPVVQTASHFRVAVRLRHKPLATFALRLGPWHKLPATFSLRSDLLRLLLKPPAAFAHLF